MTHRATGVPTKEVEELPGNVIFRSVAFDFFFFFLIVQGVTGET